ncbi:MAG: hypothetical protein AAF682_04030 [Planctomycetota bacterium]
MPVDVTSRYRLLKSYEVSDPEASSSALPARLLDGERRTSDLYQHRVSGVETIEYLAWRYLGKSNAWWHIADENKLTFPLDLRPGDVVGVPSSTQVGRVVRTRNFG